MLRKLNAVFGLVLFTLTHNTEAFKSKLSECKSLKIGDTYFTKKTLATFSGIPADISIDFSGKTIYFTLVSDEMRMEVRALSFGGEMETIDVPGVGQSTAVDNYNGIVYIASDNGLYIYNKNEDFKEPFAAKDEDIMYVSLAEKGKVIYIATWPQNRVHMLLEEGTKMQSYSDVIDGHGLVVDDKNNKFYMASKTAYLLRADESVSVKIRGLNKDKMVTYFVTRADEVFCMDEDSKMYEIDVENARAIFRGSFDLKGVNSFAIDDDNSVIAGIRSGLIKFINGGGTDPCIAKTM